jgi:hypothetical protein
VNLKPDRAPPVFTLLGVLILVACASRGSPTTVDAQVESAVRSMQSVSDGLVVNSTRARAVDTASNDLGATVLAYEKIAEQFRTKALSLNERPDATMEEFASLRADFDNERTAFRRRLFALHESLLTNTTPHEWAALAPKERALLSISLE